MSDRRNYIVSAINKKHANNWMSGNVIALEEAYHACDPDRSYGYNASAIQIDGDIIQTGVVIWDFDAVMDEADNYDWDNHYNWRFVHIDTYVLRDDDDYADLCAELQI